MEIRFIRHRDGLQPEKTIVFHNHDVGLDRLNRLPNPVFVTIDVNREKPNIFGETRTTYQGINIISRNPNTLGLEVKLPIDVIRPNKANILFVPVQNHALPVVFEQKESSVAFLIVFDAKLDESLAFDREMADEILDDAIFIPL